MGCLVSNIEAKKGCLTANISRVDSGIDCAVSLQETALIANVQRVTKGLSCAIDSLNTPLISTVGRIGKGLQVNIGLICTPNTAVYLRVNPTVLWLTPESSEEFYIESNTNWQID